MSDRIVIDEDDLEDVFSDLVDATSAAAHGDPNKCASRAADAKDRVLEIHSEAQPLEETDEHD